ncbi:MAG: hypothetical protein U0002_07160 [Thermoanaerobaculia bacterium]
MAQALRGEGVTSAFEGYGQSRLEGSRLLRLASTEGALVPALEAGASGAAVLDRTVFYAEGGGQVGEMSAR